MTLVSLFSALKNMMKKGEYGNIHRPSFKFGNIHRPNFKRPIHVNLLMIIGSDRAHYCLIKDKSRLFRSHKSTHKGKLFFCDLCLNSFTREDLLKDHEIYCQKHKPQTVYTPEAGSKNATMLFSNSQAQHRLPFVIYADMECFLEKSSDFLQKHLPASYAYYVVSDHPRYNNKGVQIYRGDNVIDHFLCSLLEEEKEMTELIEHIVPMKLSSHEEDQFKRASACHICKKLFTNDELKVKDHCHLTGTFRGAAHVSCNLNYQIPLKKFQIPVFFHNGKKYDFHLFIKNMGKYSKNIEVIPQNIENYMQIKWGNHLHFKDSVQFLSSSLDKLSDSLSSDDFIHMKNHFGDNHQLLCKKGVFPYEWFDCKIKFDHESLPLIDEFYSQLNDKSITNDEYDYAHNIWSHFNCQTFGDYHDLYLYTDVLLLSDIFETFRRTSMSFFDIDPCHYISLPSFGWNCMLKSTDIELDLLTDINMYLFFENGCRGGISSINHRYAKANNPYMYDYNSDEKSSYIIYIDKNSLYPEAMSDYLPYAHFKWEDPDHFDHESILNLSDECRKGYIFEVDLEYPAHLHKSHNNYPLASEHLTVMKNQLSLYNDYNSYHPTKKLVSNLYDKERYIVHYRNLKFYLTQGLVLKKIHKVLSFSQDKWMKPYIDLCALQRQNAKTNFQKDFWKLMMNSVFGKSMENLRHRIRLELVTDTKKALKLLSKNTYKRSIVFDDNLAAIELFKTQLCLNKPIYLGQVILELSKLYMAQYHYEHIQRKYSDYKLLFTDTDSFCYYITTKDLYQDMKNDSHHYDFSNYPINHSCFSNDNKKIIGKFKDETAGEPIIEFIGLRPKLYSILTEKENKKTMKGIKISGSRTIHHSDYKSCLFEKKMKSVSMYNIRNNNHNLRTIMENKIALSPYDDKRYVLSNGIDTLAYGNELIPP